MSSLSIIGYDQALTRRVATRILAALRRQYDYSELDTTKRGYTFVVLEEGERIMRITVEMEPWTDPRGISVVPGD